MEGSKYIATFVVIKVKGYFKIKKSMKKTVLTLFGLFISLMGYAQQLNALGEKMVKELTISNSRGINERIVFEYNDNNKVRSLSIYDGQNNLVEKFYEENGKIKHKGYDIYTESISYDIQSDEDGNITSIETILFDDDNIPVSKYRYNFKYTWDNGKYRFDESKRIEYRYDEDIQDYVKSDYECVDRLYNVNGLFKDKDDWNIETDFEHINDTNVSFYAIINSCVTRYNDILRLFLTDWINVKGDYFPKYIERIKCWNITYQYDDIGNIIQITRMFDEIINNSVDIKYIF